MAFENEHLTRQMDLVPMKILSTPITIIGAGAIGSFTALTLAKMGFSNITVWDDDKVSIENMSSQFYRFSDIGKEKPKALLDLIKDFTKITIEPRFYRFDSKSLPESGIVIAAVDSMEARRTIWNAHKENVGTKLFIDPRMGAETAMLFAMRPLDEDDAESYEKSLYTDAAALHERCTSKATAYCALSLSALVAKTVKDVAAGTPYCRTATWSVKDSQLTAWVKEWK